MAKIGRNQPCPCNSGRKYKYCCLPTHGEAIREKTQTPHDIDKEIIGRMIESEYEKRMNEIIERKTDGIVSKEDICNN